MKRVFLAGRTALVAALMGQALTAAATVSAQSPSAAPASDRKAASATTKMEPGAGSRNKPGAKRSPLAEAELLLGSPEREKVTEGLRRMKEIGKPSVIGPVSGRLRQGLPPTLAQLAMEALVKAGKPQAAPVLIELCDHRRAATRRAAVSALGQLRVRGAVQVLRDALDDGDAGVRAAAARALGRIGGRGALKDLYVAFERGEPGALSAIASVAGPKEVERLVGYLDQHPMAALEPVYLEILQRQDFPSRGKLDLIARLGERETPDAEQFLRDLPKHLPQAGRAPLMRTVGKALEKIQRRRMEYSKEGGEKQGPAGTVADKAGGEEE